MRNSIKRNVALWMVFFFLFSITGCGGGGGGGSDSAGTDNTGTDTTNQTADLQEHLTSFNTAMDWVAEDLPALMGTVDQLNTAIDADDGSAEKTLEIGLLVDSFALDAAILVIDVEAMDLAEAGIQEITNSETGLTSVIGIVTVVGVGLVIKGLYSFGQKMKGYSDDMSEARKDRDEAAEDVMNNVPGGLKKFNDSNKRMRDTGEDAIQELGTKVTTDLVLSPINPTSLTGVILADVAGNKLQDGLKVLSATKECEGGIDSPGCKIGVSKTDQADSAVVPDGDTTIVVGGGDTARTVIKEEISPGSYTEVTIDPIPIKEATPQKIADSDNAVTGDDNPPVDPVDTDPGDTDPGDTDPGDDDPADVPTMTLSAAVSSENDTSITYSVAAAVSGVTDATTVTINVANASTGSSTKTLSSDGTVIWTVTVLDEDATVTVSRSDTGDQESLTLSAKTANFDGTYSGLAVTTFEGEDTEDRWCFCWDTFGLRVTVSGTSLSGDDVSGTLSGNQVSGTHGGHSGDFEGQYETFTGSITNNVMSGTWHDSSGCCSGTFSLTKQ
ncbi:MAG: hypothetical protein PF482_20575 [Desulfobacteraceae bacterium]|jgi:hypothetical protein|nr:hypothetical protein [Desulfobacteraceae bacterium]